MSYLQQATMHNNEGVCLLHSGSHSDAIACFQAALLALNHFAPTADELQSIAAGNLVSTGVFDSSKVLFNIAQDVCYVYDRPLLIPTSIQIHSGQDIGTFFATCSSFIIFNLALAYHKSGRATGKDTPLRQAENMYQLVLQSLIGSQCTRMNATLKCLTFNNLAQLHFGRCEYKESNYYMKSMYGIIKQTGCLHGCNDFLSATEVEEITLNFCMCSPQLLPTPRETVNSDHAAKSYVQAVKLM